MNKRKGFADRRKRERSPDGSRAFLFARGGGEEENINGQSQRDMLG